MTCSPHLMHQQIESVPTWQLLLPAWQPDCQCIDDIPHDLPAALAIDGPSGASTAELVTGRSYTRGAGVEHDVRNANDFEFVFIEIEVKGRP